MEIPTYLFIIFCLSLVFINRKYLPISLILIALFLYYQRVNNSNVLLSKNGQLYINSYNKVESFQNYVPKQLGKDNLTSNWNTICTSVTCENKDMTKDSLKTVLDEFKTYIKNLNETDIDNIKGNLTGNGTPQWEFVTKQSVYNISHKHDTVGQLIYHLKNIDFNIFIQLFNKIGYEDTIITDLYDKVDKTLIKKEYLDIQDGDVIAMKIKMVHDILKKIKEEYAEFQDDANNKFEVSPENTFNKIEQCKIVKQSSPYSEFSDDVFANKTFGCPTGHYLKGMSYDVDDNTFTQNFHCCELNSTKYKQNYKEYEETSSVINNIEPNAGSPPTVVENSILSNFSFDINKTDTELGDYKQTNINSNISPDSIKISGFTGTGTGASYSYERKIYLIYINKNGTTLTSPEADAIIYDLNNVSSLKFIIPEKDDVVVDTPSSITKTGFVKVNGVNKIVNLENEALSTTEVGIFALVYGEKNHIKYAIETLYNRDIKLDQHIAITPQSQKIKNIFNIESTEENITLNFNGIYNKNQNSFTNINNPLIVLNYNPKLKYWTLEYNKVPIYHYADISTALLPQMMKEVFDETQLTEPKLYFNNAVFSGTGTPVIEYNTLQDIKKLLNITIDGKDDYNGQYLFKQLVNNRPEYTKQDNALITIKWNNNPETRRWEIKLSEDVKFTNTNNSVSIPVIDWKNQPDGTGVTVTQADVGTANDLKDYIILTKSGNYLKPKIDILSNKFMLEDSQKPHTSQPDSVIDIYKFNIIKEIDNYYIKNKQLDLYINITNDGKLILSNEKNKTPLNLIKQNSRYLIRLPNENKLATLDNLFLKMKPSFNVLNPDNNQIFEFINISSSNIFPVKANYGYYIHPSSTVSSSSNVSLTIPEKMSGYNEKQIMCQNNEYVSQLLKTDDTIELKCNKIQEEDDNIKNKRISFFNKPISDFYHSHDFIVEDPIHNIEVNSTDSYDLNKYKSKLLGTQVELYSKRDGEYLNQSSLYSPLQKILIMMVMMKINNIDSVNLDTNSLFEYFSKQNIFDIYYTELLKETPIIGTTINLNEIQ